MADARTARRVLLVEDEDHLREVLHEALDAAGYEVVDAENGLEALDWLDRVPVHLIVTDILMPGMGGHDLVAVIRRSSAWRALPILLLSGYSNLTPYRDLPVDGTLLKPFTLPDFLAEVQRITDSR